jgi:hypothetical protein
VRGARARRHCRVESRIRPSAAADGGSGELIARWKIKNKRGLIEREKRKDVRRQ